MLRQICKPVTETCAFPRPLPLSLSDGARAQLRRSGRPDAPLWRGGLRQSRFVTARRADFQSARGGAAGAGEDAVPFGARPAASGPAAAHASGPVAGPSFGISRRRPAGAAEPFSRAAAPACRLLLALEHVDRKLGDG